MQSKRLTYYWNRFRPCGYCGKPVNTYAPISDIVQCSRLKCSENTKSVKLMGYTAFHRSIALAICGY